MMLRITIVTLAAAIVAVSCTQESDLHVEFVNKMPPSFSFSGRSVATKFEIQELPRSKPLSKIDPYSIKGETIWMITTSSRIKATDWPVVTYGEIPSSFTQPVPQNGKPTKFTEDKLYMVRFVGDDDHDTRFFFVVNNRKIVNVTDKLFGP